MNKFFLFLLCGGIFSRASGAEDLDKLVDKMVGAYGGPAKLEQMAAIRQTGQVQPATREGSPDAMVRTFARPLKLRVEIGESSRPTEVRVLNGAVGWRNGKESSGMGYEAMALQAVRLDLPFQILAHRKTVVEKEPMDYQGKRLRVLELPVEGGLSVAAAIDPDTGRIVTSTGTTKSGPKGPMTFETRYDDFRNIEGRLFAYKETNFAGGTKTADITLTKVELLTSAPPEAFKP